MKIRIRISVLLAKCVVWKQSDDWVRDEPGRFIDIISCGRSTEQEPQNCCSFDVFLFVAPFFVNSTGCFMIFLKKSAVSEISNEPVGHQQPKSQRLQFFFNILFDVNINFKCICMIFCILCCCNMIGCSDNNLCS